MTTVWICNFKAAPGEHCLHKASPVSWGVSTTQLEKYPCWSSLGEGDGITAPAELVCVLITIVQGQANHGCFSFWLAPETTLSSQCVHVTWCVRGFFFSFPEAKAEPRWKKESKRDIVLGEIPILGNSTSASVGHTLVSDALRPHGL